MEEQEDKHEAYAAQARCCCRVLSRASSRRRLSARQSITPVSRQSPASPSNSPIMPMRTSPRAAPRRIPTLRVLEPPKDGVLTVRQAMLTTNKVAGLSRPQDTGSGRVLSGQGGLQRLRPCQIRGDER